MLNGAWETSIENSFGCTLRLEISTVTLHEVKICKGVPLKLKAENYSFNGKILKYKLYGIDLEYEIKELTEDRMLLGYHDPVEYYRISN